MLFIATNVPCEPSAAGIAADTSCTASKNGPMGSVLGQGHHVDARHDEDVALEQRGTVEERNCRVDVEDDVGVLVAGDDRAEHTGLLSHAPVVAASLVRPPIHQRAGGLRYNSVGLLSSAKRDSVSRWRPRLDALRLAPRRSHARTVLK